jgi:hypothetical protein
MGVAGWVRQVSVLPGRRLKPAHGDSRWNLGRRTFGVTYCAPPGGPQEDPSVGHPKAMSSLRASPLYGPANWSNFAVGITGLEA